MEPAKERELTPKETIKALCGEKEYYRYGKEENLFETKQIVAWTRGDCGDLERNITIKLKTPQTCKMIDLGKMEGLSAEKKRAEFERQFHSLPGDHCAEIGEKIFLYISLKLSEKYGLTLGEDADHHPALTFGNGYSLVAYVNADSFSVPHKNKFFLRTEELAVDLLEIYLDAHKDCCTW